MSELIDRLSDLIESLRDIRARIENGESLPYDAADVLHDAIEELEMHEWAMIRIRRAREERHIPEDE